MINKALRFISEWLLSQNFSITKDDVHFDDVVFSPYAYEQEFVKTVIDGRSVTLQSVSEIGDCFAAGRTIKVEGMEKLSPHLFTMAKRVASFMDHGGPVSAHLFLAHSGSESFPTHTDPDDVFIYVVEGTKVMEVEGEIYELGAGEALYIPHSTPHKALNKHYSVMISFGLERYTLEKLPS